jgi:hypothetical protein
LEAYPSAATYLNKVGKTPIDYFFEGIQLHKENVENVIQQLENSDELVSSKLKDSIEIDDSNHLLMNALDCMRILLFLPPLNYLNEDQRSLLRKLNWIARKNGVIASYSVVAGSNRASRLCRLRQACLGVWQHIITFL